MLIYKNIILPASILAGTIVGAGVFSLPFVFQASGFLTGIFYLIAFALIFVFINLLYADVAVRTPGEHRFVSYSGMYLGDWGFWIAILIGLVQMLFVLTVYIILAPSFSQIFFTGDIFYHLSFFWVLGSLLLLFDIKRIALIEFLITAGIILIILFTFILGFRGIISKEINWAEFNPSNLLAVGPILFALSGIVAIPEAISYFRESKVPISLLKNVIFWGMASSVIIYFLFIVGVLGLSGTVTEDAISGFMGEVPYFVIIAIGILGLLSLLSSYIVVGLDVRRIMEYDLLMSNHLSKILVIFIPIFLYIVGFQNFIEGVDFIGKIFLPLEAIFVIFIWLNANKKLELPPILLNKKRASLFITPLLFIFVIILIYGVI